MAWIRSNAIIYDTLWEKREAYTASADIIARFPGRVCWICDSPFRAGDVVSIVNTAERGNLIVHEICLANQIDD